MRLEQVIDIESKFLPKILVGVRYLGANDTYRDVLLKSPSQASSFSALDVPEQKITYTDGDEVRTCSYSGFKSWLRKQKRILQEEARQRSNLYWSSHEEVRLGLSQEEAKSLAEELHSIYEPAMDSEYVDYSYHFTNQVVELLMDHSFIRERLK